VVVTVERGYAGLLTNTVEVTTQEGATGLYTQVITSVVIPALSLVKEASPTTANVGETITYTYTVENIGSAILTTVSVTDDHLRGIGLVTTTLAPHDITTGTATYVVQQSDLPGPLVNVVTVTCTPPMGNPITATASVTLTSHPAIRVAKDANVSAARVGETITYRYTITNTGDVTLTDIRASDNRLGPIRLGADSLPPAAVTTGSATHTLVKADRPGPIINTVTVTGASPTGLVTASASDNVAIPPCWPPAGAVLLVALTSYVVRRNTSQPPAL
jgi:hypothetical protein